jgi:hypothetical protein
MPYSGGSWCARLSLTTMIMVVEVEVILTQLRSQVSTYLQATLVSTTDYRTIEIFALFEGFLAPNHPKWGEIPSRGRKSFLAVDLVISY